MNCFTAALNSADFFQFIEMPDFLYHARLSARNVVRHQFARGNRHRVTGARRRRLILRACQQACRFRGADFRYSS